MLSGMIFNIQRFSLHDGPGIRTTVFFKGCPLHCKWCHNPEGTNPFAQLLYDAQKCVGCRACLKNCPNGCHVFQQGIHFFRRDLCTACGICTRGCASEALQICGQEMTVEEVLDVTLKDCAFYEESGGGMTLSGGEPLMQPDFALALMKGAHENGIHCAVESSGYADENTVQMVLGEADLILMDWKISGRRQLTEDTGASMDVIGRTLRTLCKMEKPVWLRCPVIPGVNDSASHFDQIVRIVEQYKNIRQVHVMAYHDLGETKYVRLAGKASAFKYRVPDGKELEGWIKEISDRLPEIPVRKG